MRTCKGRRYLEPDVVDKKSVRLLMLIFSGCVIMVLGQHCWLNGIITSWESIQSHYTCKNYPDLSISRPVYLRISVRFLHMLIYRTTDRKIWVNVTLTVTVAFKCEKRR